MPHMVKTSPQSARLPEILNQFSHPRRVISMEIKSPLGGFFNKGYAQALRDIRKIDVIPTKFEICAFNSSNDKNKFREILLRFKWEIN